MFLTDAIREKRIFGSFKRFVYRCGGYFLVVYCRNEEDFLRLISQWNIQSYKFCTSKFFYTVESRDGGTPMSLDEIVKQPIGCLRLKSVLIDPNTGIEYIQ